MNLAYSRLGHLASRISKRPQAPCHTHTLLITSLLPRATTRVQLQHRRQQRQQHTTTTTAPTPETTQNDTPSLPDQVRLLMRRVPYPVAIITSTDPHAATPERSIRGMTVSSFNTVTLHPEPVVSFNVKRPSETLSAILASGRFVVHLLAARDDTAALAREFSRGNHNLVGIGGFGFGFVESVSSSSSSSGSGSGGMRVGEGGGGGSGRGVSLPVLRRTMGSSSSPSSNSEDNACATLAALESFPFVFECRLNPQRVEVYDHTLILGTITGMLDHRHHSSCPSPHDRRQQHQHQNQQHQKTTGNTASANPNPAENLCLTYANTRFWKMGHEI